MIREAELTSRDISGVKRLIAEGVSKGHLLSRTDQDLEDLIEQRHLYVADHTMGIIGCAALDVYSKRLAEIRSVFVIPYFRRTKLGTLLIERCLEEAKRLNIQEVLSITDQTRFFEKIGFRKQLYGQSPMFIKLN